MRHGIQQSMACICTTPEFGSHDTNAGLFLTTSTQKSKNRHHAVDPEASLNVATEMFPSEQRCKPARVKAGRCRRGGVAGAG
ncbi:hypothetical protein E2C01_041909 [Portunus trituberculatus]|uniref:Uncharacterized protein n=1 Tax=Portunus trituberculatus TaxID=210409 RepID=A0A5B7FNR8_PORTR|nr:hypothetical protein [Portunus trituberculatus]